VKAGPPPREHAWSEDRLVRECRDGNQAAWSALIEKYKNLIFSIPIKFGLSREDAADIFQAVCADLVAGLPRLREPKALPKWLMQAAFHQCLRWKKDRLVLMEDAEEMDRQPDPKSETLPEEMLYQLQKEQRVREAIRSLPSRCGRMVQMLFFESSARPYQEIAKELGIATGSIGFIRGRCLKKLRLALEKGGFQGGLQ
jgi:RNA polymerase sigma factor (sigma-70 family)